MRKGLCPVCPVCGIPLQVSVKQSIRCSDNVVVWMYPCRCLGGDVYYYRPDREVIHMRYDRTGRVVSPDFSIFRKSHK